MLHGLWRRGGGYALAVVATCLALAARFALAPLLPPTGFPFLTFFPAVVLTALFGGLGPGLVASALSIAAADYFFIPTLGSFRLASAADAIALGFFAAVLLVDCVVIHVMTTSLVRVRRSRADLAASEQRFRALAEATREGVVIHDGGIIADANDAFWRMHGFASRDEVVGRPVMDLIAPEGREAVADSIRRRSAEPYESIGLRPDGSTFPIEIEARAIEHHGRPMRVAISRDLTRRKAAERAQAEGEARLRDLVATLDLGAFMTRDPDGTIRFWSRGCERLYGWTAEEAVGRVAHDLLRTGFPLARADMEAALEREGEWAGDLRQHRRDGRAVAVAVRKVLRRDAAGQPGSVLEILADVTAQRRTEAALSASETRLRSIVDTAADGILVADASGRIVSANPAALRLFGYDDGPDGLLGRNLELLMPAAEAARHGDYLAAHRATGRARAIGVPGRTLMGRRRDGTEFPIELSVGSFEAGGERFFTGVVRDVSRRVAAEAALRESEATLNAVLDALPVGVILADASGRIMRDNAANRELWGVPPETANWEQYGSWVGWWPETGQRIRAEEWGMARALLKGETVRGELVQCERFGTGERRFYLNSAAPVRDAEGRIVAGVVAELDVTDRRAMEAALAESEARFRALAEAIPSLLFETDAAGANLYMNRRFSEYTGLPLDALTGDGWLRIIHPEDRTRSAKTWAAAVRSGGAYEIEYRFRRHDGAYRWFLGRGMPVRDREGRILRWVGTCTDIEDRRQAEEALRASEVRLRIEAERVDLALRAGAIVGTWDWDLPTDRFTVDERFAESFGIDLALGRTGLSLEQVIATVYPDDLAGLRAAIDKAIARGGPYSHEYRVRGRDGVFRWIEANGRVDHAPDGTPLRFPGVLLDVERRRAAEERLREGEARLRLALEAGRMGFWSWDLRTDQLEWGKRQPVPAGGASGLKFHGSNSSRRSMVWPRASRSMTVAM